MIIGPCSADQEDAVLEYVNRLVNIQEKVADTFLIIPRVYTSKPRTNGQGYKGMLHRPNSASSEENLLMGVLATRKMHFRVIQETGMYCADEMLYPEGIYYLMDLLAYVAVGARSVENQSHRMTASGLEMPVGMKNPISGDIGSMLNAIAAAQHEQQMMYRGWEVKTEGNPYAHAILRGYTDTTGRMHPNYHYEDLCTIHDRYQEAHLKNMALVIDCNHSNSAKKYYEQIRISKELCSLCKETEEINHIIKGVMIESYLEDGAQLPGQNVYGKSLTDACLGWQRTEILIRTMAEILNR